MSKKDDLTRIEDLEEFVHVADPFEEKEGEEGGEGESAVDDDAFGDFPSVPEEGDQEVEFGEETQSLEEESDPSLPSDEWPQVEESEESNEAEEGEAFGEAEEIVEVEEAAKIEEVEKPPEKVAPHAPGKGPDEARAELPESRPKVNDPPKEIQTVTADPAHSRFSSERGPSFSIVIRNIEDEEIKEEIKHLLTTIGLKIDPFERGLALGQVLIGQISEYCAIFLAHKLRNLDVDIKFGLSEQIHPSENDDEGGSI